MRLIQLVTVFLVLAGCSRSLPVDVRDMAVSDAATVPFRGDCSEINGQIVCAHEPGSPCMVRPDGLCPSPECALPMDLGDTSTACCNFIPDAGAVCCQSYVGDGLSCVRCSEGAWSCKRIP